MFPRYLPNVGWRDWRDWLAADARPADDAWARLMGELGGADAPQFHYAFDSLRTGLSSYFSSLKRHGGGGNVLVSSQICRAVPQAIEQSGLTVRYVDIDTRYPTPSASQFRSALDPQTVGVLVAPIYGHLQGDWAPLLDALARRVLVLDLAQGVGLASSVAELLRRADVVAYSFGIGKGLDIGGGLLLTRSRLDVTSLPTCSKARIAAALAKTATLRMMASAGLYGAVVSRLDTLGAGEASFGASGAIAPDDICRLWQARLAVFLGEVELARSRARKLAGNMPLTAKLRDAAIYFGDASTHLRQVIRVRDAARRDALIARLRAAGVDCAPAGEPLPNAAAAADFPNAAAFRSDGIRLSFLGRLTERQFDRYGAILEQAVVQGLS